SVKRVRHLEHLRTSGILRDAAFAEEPVPIAPLDRQAYFAKNLRVLGAADLVFFDPDNGIEVPSCPGSRKRSVKYLQWVEIAATYDQGKSLLIYQHFSRESRDSFVRRISTALKKHTS